jgi:hypothetical protein
MCHHWVSDRDHVWEDAREELPEEDPEDEEPRPEHVTPTADDD